MKKLKAKLQNFLSGILVRITALLTPYFIVNLLNEAQWQKAEPFVGTFRPPIPTKSDSRQVKRAKIRALAFITASQQMGLVAPRSVRRGLARKAQYLARATGA